MLVPFPSPLPRARFLLAWLFITTSTMANAQAPWTLEACIQRADAENLDVRNSALQVELAQQSLEQARMAMFPDLNMGATHGYNFGRVVDRFTNTFANDRVRTNNFFLSSQADLFGGMRNQNRLKQTKADMEAAESGLAASRNDVRLAVAQAFLDVLGLQESIAAQEAQLKNQQEQLVRVEALVQAGRSAKVDLYTQRSQLAQAELDLLTLRNRSDMRRLQLGQQLRLEAAELPTFRISSPPLSALSVVEPVVGVEDIMPQVLAANPAYKQALANEQSAQYGWSVARGASAPSLGVQATVGTGFSGRNFVPVGEPRPLDPAAIGFTESGEQVFVPNSFQDTEVQDFGAQLDENLNESLTLNLSIPLFNKGQNKLAQEQARVAYEQAANAREQQEQSLRQSVQEALNQQRAAYRQHAAALRAQEAAQEALRAVQERYDAGASNLIDLDTARTNLVRATADAIAAKYSYTMAAKSLEILQGITPTL
jgi:outer membrane protein